jgi:hypothetical protein
MVDSITPVKVMGVLEEGIDLGVWHGVKLFGVPKKVECCGPAPELHFWLRFW